MPDEKPVEQEVSPTSEETPAKTDNVASAGMRAGIEAKLQNPYWLLVMTVYLIAVGGVLQTITNVLGWNDSGEQTTRELLNNIFMIVGALSLIIGMIAIVDSIRARKSGVSSVIPEQMTARLLHPVWLLSIAPYVFATIGILIALYYFVDRLDWALQYMLASVMYMLFFTSAGTFLLFTLKAISDWLNRSTATVDSAAPAAAATASASESSDSASEETGEGATETTAATTSPVDQVKAVLNDPNRLLMFGVYLTAYFGVLATVFNMWGAARNTAGSIWAQFFLQMAIVTVAVGFLMVARPMINWISGAGTTDGEMARGADEKLGHWMQRLSSNPMHMINVATIMIIAGIAPFYLVSLWGDRNAPVEVFWDNLLGQTLRVVIILGALLVLRSAAQIVLSGPVSSMGERLKSAANGPMLNDPGQLLRVLVYLIAFVGLMGVCLSVWVVRGRDEWQVFYYLFYSLGAMVVPLAMALGGRAMYAEIED